MKLRALVVGIGLLCSFSSFAATELRYGLEAEYPPFESRNASGELEGFDVELGNAICKAAALKCSWVETSFDALIPGLLAKKFDAINSAMNITEQRRKSIDFTQPIYRIPSQLVGKAGSAVEATPEGLKGKTIGVEQGSAQETYVNQHWRPQGINIVAYQGADSVVRDLESGRIDGAVLSGMMADYSFLQQPQGKEFAFVGGHLQDDTLFGAGAAIGLRKDDEALRQEINGAIAKILADGTYKKLAGKYFSFDVYSGT